MRRIGAVVAGALLALAATGGPAAAQEPIRIGINKPFSGPVSFIGQDEKVGFEWALAEINAKGILGGRKIQLFYGDNQCNPTEGVNAARKLIDLDKVVAMISGACSSATLAIMPVIEEAKIPNLTISSTNPRITQMAGVGGNVWQFRLNVDDSTMAKTFSRVIAEKAKTVAMFGPNNDFGRGAAAAYGEEFKKVGVRLLTVEYFEQGTADYRPQLTKVKSMSPQALLLVMESRDASVLVRQLRESGMRPTLFARGSVVTNEFAKAIRDDCSLGEGLVEATFGANGISPAFDRRFEQAFKQKPHIHHGISYSGLHALARAIELGGKAEPDAIRQGLKKLDFTDPILGPVKFDDHNQAHTNMALTTMSECQVKLLKVVPTN